MLECWWWSLTSNVSGVANRLWGNGCWQQSEKSSYYLINRFFFVSITSQVSWPILILFHYRSFSLFRGLSKFLFLFGLYFNTSLQNFHLPFFMSGQYNCVFYLIYSYWHWRCSVIMCSCLCLTAHWHNVGNIISKTSIFLLSFSLVTLENKWSLKALIKYVLLVSCYSSYTYWRRVHFCQCLDLATYCLCQCSQCWRPPLYVYSAERMMQSWIRIPARARMLLRVLHCHWLSHWWPKYLIFLGWFTFKISAFSSFFLFFIPLFRLLFPSRLSYFLLCHLSLILPFFLLFSSLLSPSLLLY